MVFRIATNFDINRRKETVQVVEIPDAIVFEMITNQINRMSYEQRQRLVEEDGKVIGEAG